MCANARQRRIRAAAAEVTLRRWQRDGGGCGCTGDCGNTALRRLESGGRSDDDGAMAVLETAAAFKSGSNAPQSRRVYMHLLVEKSVPRQHLQPHLLRQSGFAGMPLRWHAKARTLLGRS